MKKPPRFDEMMDLIASVDDASKPYDGPIAFVQPTLEMRMKDIAHRRKQMEVAFDNCAPQRAGDINWDVIEAHLGLGNMNAPVVFVGMEEGLADPAKLESDLKYRSTFSQPVMDVYEMHLDLAKGRKLFGERPRGQRTWRVMADVMLHYENRVPKKKKERADLRKAYRANILGDAYDLTLLLELLPLPHGNIKQWLYKKYGLYETREEYESKVIDRRIEQLREALGQHDRKAIICYGRKSWDSFRRLFPEALWKPGRESFGEYLTSEWKGPKVTLTSHFVSKNFNSDEQLDELAAVALPQSPKE